MFARILADSDERRRICREKELPKNIEKMFFMMTWFKQEQYLG